MMCIPLKKKQQQLTDELMQETKLQCVSNGVSFALSRWNDESKKYLLWIHFISSKEQRWYCRYQLKNIFLAETIVVMGELHTILHLSYNAFIILFKESNVMT